MATVGANRVFRWGIVGSGKISQDFVRALKNLGDAQVVAIAARKLEDAQSTVKLCAPDARAYEGYESIATDKDVDIVYIGTVHSTHLEAAMVMLKHGKPLLIEKAFTQNAKQAAEIISYAKEHKIFVMEAMWARFMPWCIKLRELLSNGAIGEVHQVTADFGIHFDPNAAKRLFDPLTAGGALLDVGIYPVSIISHIFGGTVPEQIVALGDLTDQGVDNQVNAILKYGKNRMGQVLSSAIFDTNRYLYILGTKGRIEVHDPSVNFFHASTTLTLKRKEGDEYAEPEVFNFPKEIQSTKLAKDNYNFLNSEMLVFEAFEVQKCIHEGKTESTIMPLDETLTIMKTLDEIRRQVGVVYPNEK